MRQPGTETAPDWRVGAPGGEEEIEGLSVERRRRL